MMIHTRVLTGYGINADDELVRAFSAAGSEVEKTHLTDLIENPKLLEESHILAFPGGFSFGDHLGSGLVLAHLCRQRLKPHLERFVASGRLLIGICNGFQVLVKMGILPNIQGDWSREVSLIHNDTGTFEDSWVPVTFNPESRCVWTAGLSRMELPIRHGEGRFISSSPKVRKLLVENNLIALTYAERNPNGSELDIAGITDPTGRILGLMPHPEAFLSRENHPRWTRETVEEGFGIRLFENGVAWMKQNQV